MIRLEVDCELQLEVAETKLSLKNFVSLHVFVLRQTIKCKQSQLDSSICKSRFSREKRQAAPA